MPEKSCCDSGRHSFRSVSPKTHVMLSDDPVAWLDAGQVRIRPLGPLPPFIHQTRVALERGDVQTAAQILGAQPPLDSQDPVSRLDVIYMAIRLWVQMGQARSALPWCMALAQYDTSALAAWQVSECLVEDTSRLSEALTFARRAVERDAQVPVYRKHLACLLCRAGFVEEGLTLFESLLIEEPDDALLLSDWLWYSQYSPRSSRSKLQEGYAHLQTLRFLPRKSPVFNNDRDPERPLRVGIVSPDFKYCSAVMALELMLHGFDRKSLTLVGYGHVAQPDAKTKELQTLCREYRDIYELPAEEAAALIRADRIDILLANGGNIRDHRLDVFPYRPAPIQIDYGGLSTLGVAGMDYRFTDELMDPVGTQATYAEKLLALPGGLCCFHPPAVSPAVFSLPAQHNGFITFGSFNSHLKFSAPLWDAWAQLMQAVPNACLVIKCLAVRDQDLKRHYQQQLLTRGVRSERVTFLVPTDSYFDHLACYQQVDLALDTFPFNGGITTLEGLWMGVPPITLVGDSFVGRFGVSILHRIGLDIFAVHSTQEYIDKARAFAAQPEALATIRRSLRQTLLQSSLCDPKRITGEMAVFFRQLWRQWCQEAQP